MITPHEINFDPKNIIQYEYDDAADHVNITSGDITSKQQFIDLWHEQLLITFASQVSLTFMHPQEDGCIDPKCSTALDWIKAFKDERCKELLSELHHKYDNSKVSKELK